MASVIRDLPPLLVAQWLCQRADHVSTFQCFFRGLNTLPSNITLHRIQTQGINEALDAVDCK